MQGTSDLPPYSLDLRLEKAHHRELLARNNEIIMKNRLKSFLHHAE